MPLPFLALAAAIVAGATGVGAAANGINKMSNAKKKSEDAQKRHNANIKRFERENRATTRVMDDLGRLELACIKSFGEFQDTIEKIQGEVTFGKIKIDGVQLPKYDGAKLREVSVGAGVLLGAAGGAGLGALGGIAASGATTAAVMALGTAGTGTAIASLSGIAATNATLAVLGGGTLAAGGGGVALGTTVLGAATLGVGLLVGGVIFNITGSSLSEKADEAWKQMLAAEEKIDKTVRYLQNLYKVSINYREELEKVNTVYQDHLQKMKDLVNRQPNTNFWLDEDFEIVENTELLVGILYRMCKVQLVIVNEHAETNRINQQEIDEAKKEARIVMHEVA